MVVMACYQAEFSWLLAIDLLDILSKKILLNDSLPYCASLASGIMISTDETK